MHLLHFFTYEFCTRFECAKATQDLSVWYASVDFAPENYKIHIYSNTNPDSRDYGRYYWSVMHKNGVSTNPSGMHYTSLSRAARAAIGTLMTLQAREEEQPDAPVSTE